MAKAASFLDTVFDSFESTDELYKACFNKYDSDRYILT